MHMKYTCYVRQRMLFCPKEKNRSATVASQGVCLCMDDPEKLTNAM